MCGIAGMVGLPALALEEMLASMSRRGADDRGLFQDQQTVLLHARLTVIDAEGGRQPMELSWAGEEYCLIYTGELYNTEELRAQLLARGHCFQGRSDTEVLLHAYAEFGADCVHRFNGIFAFAVWEKRRRRLFLARDRIGVKPLFYRLHRGGLLFSSQLKTILLYPDVEAKLDETGAAQVILLGPGRLPGSGVFQGIYELEPGCRGYFEEGKLQIDRYWKLMDREHTDSFEETAARVRCLVTDAVRRQMVSDVPIGTFLSGGLDSSIVTAICAGDLRDRGEVLQTFSVDYENNDRYFQASRFQPDGDNVYIGLMQEACRTDHHWTVLTPEELVNSLEEATVARDLPGMADVDSSILLFAGEIRKHVKVALSGECADEIFGGYPWYRDPQMRAQTGFPWAQNTADRASLLTLPFSGRDFIMDACNTVRRESDVLPGQSQQERRLKEMVNLNFRYFMQTLLNRMSMCSFLETRVPFCDYRIAEYLYGVPWEFKDYQGREKGLLRYAMEGLLPDKVLKRKKSPYPKTFDPRYENLISEKIRVLFEDNDAPIWHMINRSAARKLLETQSQWPWYGQLMQRPQTMAYFLQVNFWLRHYQINFTF